MNNQAQTFVLVMGQDQFGHRDYAKARREASKRGGQESCHMSFQFLDGSFAYLTDQSEWKVKA